MDNNGQPVFCPKCGLPLIPGKAFCGECGTKIASAKNDISEEKTPIQNANPYIQQTIQNINPYSQQQSTQSANPYSQQQTAQSANPYSQQQASQSANPYSQQQSAQNANPYSQQQSAQNANPYSQQQATQNANPYSQQQSSQNANPYSQQQTSQNANPYSQQQPAQNINPYSQQTAQNNFNQAVNPYAYNGTETENLNIPQKRSKKPFVIAGISVLGVAAVAVAGVMIFNMLKPSGGPITRIIDSAKQLAQAKSATVSLVTDTNGYKSNLNMKYEIDPSKKEVVMVMNGTTKSNSSDPEQNIKTIIYCKDGIRRAGSSLYGEEMTYREIDEETLNSLFDNLNKANEKPDWNTLIEDSGMSEYINSEQVEAVSKSLVDTFENGDGKEALGITESSENGGTKYSFDIDTYKALKIAVDTIEPVFKDKTKYKELNNQLSESESYLNNIRIKFNISVDGSGNFSGFGFDSFGVKINLTVSNVGNTKTDLSEAEINEIKNADTSADYKYSSDLYDDYYENDNYLET